MKGMNRFVRYSLLITYLFGFAVGAGLLFRLSDRNALVQGHAPITRENSQEVKSGSDRPHIEAVRTTQSASSARVDPIDQFRGRFGKDLEFGKGMSNWIITIKGEIGAGIPAEPGFYRCSGSPCSILL